MVNQVILINLRRFAADLLAKTKFDSLRFLQCFQIIPLKNDEKLE